MEMNKGTAFFSVTLMVLKCLEMAYDKDETLCV